jgi:hypothetical protein
MPCRQEKKTPPAVRNHPAALLRRYSSMSSNHKSSAGHPAFAKRNQRKLRELEDAYRHQLMPDEERMEVRDRVLRLRRRLGL